MTILTQKRKYMKKLSDDSGRISALAFDQRGALKKMMANYQQSEPTFEQIKTLKTLVSEELTLYSSSILLDPEYGLEASNKRHQGCGLLLAYEKTGYDVTSTSRLPDCLAEWSVKRLKEAGADAVKFLLYYDVDGDPSVNVQKQAYIERIGSECQAEGLPFFLEILSYDETIKDNTSLEFAKVKPRKVNEAMKIFSNERFGIDVLKVEVPVNMNFVEGFSNGEIAYTKEEAGRYFNEQELATPLPYIYLSAGVSAQLFQETLLFAHQSGAKFNGVLCGRATWADVVPVYIEKGEEEARKWLRTKGRENIEQLDHILSQTASSWLKKM